MSILALNCIEQHGLSIHPLTTEQLPAAVELDQICFGGLWTLAGYQRELDSPNSELLALTHTDTNNCASLAGLGCFWAILEEAHITVLAVHPQYQRQGFGQLLLYVLLQSARQRGLEWATLEVRVSNQPAIALYEKFGFQEVGRRRRYYPDTDEDGLILWRKGLQSSEFEQDLAQWHQTIEHSLRQRAGA